MLGHRVGPRRPLGQASGELARPLVETVVVVDPVDRAPALELLGGEELACHHQLRGAGAAGALGEALGAAHRRGQADDPLDQAELGGAGGDDQIAGQR